MQPKTFIFDTYRFDAVTGELRLGYAYDTGETFEEVITFKPPYAAYDQDVLDRAFRLLFLLAGVSYYKAFVPEKLVCKAFALDAETARWMERVYESGLGEFAYRNDLNLIGKIHFEYTLAIPQKIKAPVGPASPKTLVPVGGGKDSVVTLEALRAAGHDVTCFALGGPAGAAQPIGDCVKVSGLPSVFVSRVIAPSLIALNKTGVYNGHVPITAILSAIALASAVLYGFGAVVLSNEHSASAPNIVDGDFEVNHQYSKSFEFEQDLARYVQSRISPNLQYFSYLRPYSEIAIAQKFAKHPQYHSVFRSCNTAFRQDAAQRGTHWCCNCPKCRFVFLALAPFVSKEKLTDIFGRNMLDDAAQYEGFAELCGVSAYKPFECVGEIEESVAVIGHLARGTEWADDAVVKTLGSKVMPHDFYGLLRPYPDHAVPEAYQEDILRGAGDVLIWGMGKEGRAAADFVKAHWAPKQIRFIDETPQDNADVISDTANIAEAMRTADVIIKSPGVSLYKPEIMQVLPKVTSLINLWWPKRPKARMICITGTKGKSTTSALLTHTLNRLGIKAAVLGNIGVPVTEAPKGMDALVVEMSSYQIANFTGHCDIAAVTSLYPEHLNWHGTLDAYYADKMRLLACADARIVHPQVASVWPDLPQGTLLCRDAAVEDVSNVYLKRAHNLCNVGIVLEIVRAMGLDARAALQAMSDFKGLPHRQQELGEREGLLFVDDSISTTPQAAIAAIEVYKGKPVTLIAGGYDRGIDYAPLVAYVAQGGVDGVVALGPSGQRIADGLLAQGYKNVVAAADMTGAMSAACKMTPKGGVVLLSPAAPSFGLFRDYVERGQAFAKAAGF